MAYEVKNTSTQHGLDTPYGYNTPHRHPTLDDLIVKYLLSLSKDLYPTGRAWYMVEKSNFESLHQAINLSFGRLVQDSLSTIDSTLPDNKNFTIDDANLWEYRLGLITNDSISIEDRRQSILRKLAYPANVKARQHPLYIESQLQSAGFDVYLHENTKPYKTPESVIGASPTNVQHGGVTQHSDSTQHGSGSYDVVANGLFPGEVFSIGGDQNLWATFFIGGVALGDIANIPQNREQEFRELVLKLKPAHTVAFLLINFT